MMYPILAAATAVHHTGTEDSPWDAGAAVGAMPNQASTLKACHAWVDPEGDPDAKGSYKFPHHHKAGSPASLAACRNGLARLSSAHIPDGDRAGVKAHLQAHLDDAHSSSGGNHVDLGRLTNLAEALRERTAPARAARADGSWYRIHNLGDTTEVYLYDMIGEWGVTAQQFVAELKQVTGPVDLHLNCEGGEVWDGIAIYEALARHPGPVTAHVDSLAASSASFIIQAAGRRVMARNARMMIHDAHAVCIGNATVMREAAGLLDDMSDNIASIYADRAGGTVADWRARMQAGVDGTWYTAQAAVDAGLADEVTAASTANPASGGAAPLQVAAALKWDPNAFLATLREVEEPPPQMPTVLPWQIQSDEER